MKIKQSRLLLPAALPFAAAFWLAGCGRHQPTTVRIAPGAPVSARPAELPPTPPPSASAPINGRIYIVDEGSTGDSNNLVARSVSFENPKQPALSAIKSLIAAPNSPIPDGTTVRRITIADGLATVDFSHEFRDNFHGGDTHEAQTINSILKTLGQFPNIKQVQILVDGKTIDALSNFDISKPLDVVSTETASGKADRT